MGTKVSVITPAAPDRPQTLALCRAFVMAQTVDVAEHIVCKKGSLRENLLFGLSEAKGDIVAIFEDDDYYSPDWLAWCVHALDKERAQIVRQAKAHYYHIPTGQYRQPKTPPGLCTFAFTQKLLPLLVKFIKEAKPKAALDLLLWRKLDRLRVPRTYFEGEQPHVVGIKGLPGTPGLGAGHCDHFYSSKRNTILDCLEERPLLRALVGEQLTRSYLGLVAASIRRREEKVDRAASEQVCRAPL